MFLGLLFAVKIAGGGAVYLLGALRAIAKAPASLFEAPHEV